MKIELQSLAEKVKKKSRSNETRQNVAILIYQDMPVILRDEYKEFMKKPFNEDKDTVDFYYIKLFQMKRFVGEGQTPQNFGAKPFKSQKEESKHEQPKLKTTRTIGDLLKSKENEK